MSPSRMIESRRMIELAVIRSPARPGRHFARCRPTSMYRPRGVLRTSHPHGEFWRLTECRLLAPIAKWSTSERWPSAARKQKLQVCRRRPRISRYAPDGGRRADGAVLSAFCGSRTCPLQLDSSHCLSRIASAKASTRIKSAIGKIRPCCRAAGGRFRQTGFQHRSAWPATAFQARLSAVRTRDNLRTSQREERHHLSQRSRAVTRQKAL